MKILSITAQKPHSTGSGTYLTELVRAWNESGHIQAAVFGIFPEDTVSFPDGVACYPVYFSHKHSDNASISPGASDFVSSEPVISCKARSQVTLPFPVVGMSDIMPYESTLYLDLTPEMISQFEDAFIAVISQAISDLDPDLIVCHHLFLLTSLVRKHFPDRCIAGISHGTDLRQMVNCDNLRDLVRPEIAGLDHIFALHDEQRDKIIELFGVSGDKVSVIGSGYNDRLFNAEGRIPRCDLENLTAAEDLTVPVMICYAGKISRPKGVPELLKAVVMMSADDDLPPFEVTLAGGCQDPEVQKLLEDLPSNIHWIGQVPQVHLADIFRYSDIFVLPSYFEGLPLVLIEAMASGMTPVCTDLPGIRPWIEKNVPDNNVIFVPMPEMETIDAPTEPGREKFTNDLYEALRSAVSEIPGCTHLTVPDTSGITWRSVAERVLQYCS